MPSLRKKFIISRNFSSVSTLLLFLRKVASVAVVTLSFSAYRGRLDVSKSTGLSVFCNSLNISSPLTSTIIGLSAVFSGLYGSAQQRQLYSSPGCPPSGGICQLKILPSRSACFPRTLSSFSVRQI